MQPEWQSHYSDTIITVSESTKMDLINFYDIDPKKIEVIYSGISPTIKRLDNKEIEVFKQKNNLPQNFILYLGKLEPRKNIVSLIKAFDLIRKNLKYDLVIVGSRGWLDREIFEIANKSPNSKNIIFKDYISDELRSGYYSSASVFVYPSFFEGFGFPPLEAMICGTPVITSFNSSLPEVAGGAGIIIDPTNVYDISTSIENILNNKEFRTKIISKGYNKANEFNWTKTAIKTLACLLE